MPITTSPLSLNTRPPTTSTKLLEASGLNLPAQAVDKPVPAPIPTEKISLHEQAKKLSDAAQVEIRNLKARDAKVREHEQAHLSAAAGLNVTKANLTYQRGPDGVQYAVAGDVSIDTSPGRTPADSLARGELIVDVALAPADPSPSDRSAAAKGQSMAQQARAELLQQSRQADVQEHRDSQQTVSKAYDSSKPASKKIDTFA